MWLILSLNDIRKRGAISEEKQTMQDNNSMLISQVSINPRVA